MKARRLLIISVVLILLCPGLMGESHKIGENTIDISECRFGFAYDGMLLCNPVYIGPKENDYFEFAAENGITFDYSKSYFAPFPESTLAHFIADKYGDTAVILRSGRQYRAVIVKAGLYSDACYTNWQYTLTPIDTIMNLAEWKETFLVTPSAKKYSGDLVGFKEYRPDDVSFLKIVDSVKQHMEDTWIIYNEEKDGEFMPVDADRISIKCYGRDTDSMPDNMFMSVGCYTGNSTSTWSALYRLKYENDSWNTESIVNPEMGPGGYRFDSAFDLNGDGVMEYLLIDYGGASIYEIDDNGFILITSSDYRGC